MERDIAKKPQRTLRRTCCKVRLDFLDEGALADHSDVPGAAGLRQWIFPLGCLHARRMQMAQRRRLAGPHPSPIHEQLRGEYGWPRMHRELLARGLRVGKERVHQLMQRHGIRAKGKRKFVVTTDSAHRLPVAPDLWCSAVSRRQRPTCCGAVTSPTSPPTKASCTWAAVLDLHSRQVVGWSLQSHMQTSLVKDALLMACFRRRSGAGLIFHSDRGSQYCTLTAWGIRSSMSRKGNCWDNAPTESLWGRLKTACVHGRLCHA